MKSFNIDQPIYIGFSGPAGSGKTSTAKKIVPSAFTMPLSLKDDEALPGVIWDHFTFAAPLYELYSIRTTIQGDDSMDRILYSIHELYSNVMSRRISYDDFVELVYDLYSLPITNRADQKPRSFLQQAGDLCLKRYPDCFANYTKYEVYKAFQHWRNEYNNLDQDNPWYIAIVSDVRKLNEAAMIKSRPNNLLIKLTASEKVLSQRLLERGDGVLTKAQAEHHTEQDAKKALPDEMFDLILDTTDLTLEEQVKLVYNEVLTTNQFEV